MQQHGKNLLREVEVKAQAPEVLADAGLGKTTKPKSSASLRVAQVSRGAGPEDVYRKPNVPHGIYRELAGTLRKLRASLLYLCQVLSC